MKAKLEEIRAKSKRRTRQRRMPLKLIEELRVKYAGKKGELTAILKQMGKLSPRSVP